jgi:hypothetical protein
MAIELSLFNNSVTTLVNHLTGYYGEEAKRETHVTCARVKNPNIPGGSGINRIVGPNGHERAGGLRQEVLKAVEGDGTAPGNLNPSSMPATRRKGRVENASPPRKPRTAGSRRVPDGSPEGIAGVLARNAAADRRGVPR